MRPFLFMSTFLLRNLRFAVTPNYDLNKEIAHKLKLSSEAFSLQRIIRRALDFRRKNVPMYDFSVLLEIDSHSFHHPDLLPYLPSALSINPKTMVHDAHPYIIGMGPAGLFCALAMVEKGLQPYLFDQGDAVSKRAELVDKFWRDGVLDESSNVQFGEGGAGAFSDGKLTCRSKDPVIDKIFDLLIGFGADPEISWDALPHLGTDGMRSLVIKIRQFLLSQGCKFFYRHKFEWISLSETGIKEVKINGEIHHPEVLVLALGNAARDSYRMLHKQGVSIVNKAFAMGFRIEHEQDYINRAVYGSEKWKELLGAATYRVVDKNSSSYSFCMCPGGEVIASSSVHYSIVTNGMSYSNRSGFFANSAIVTAVDERDYGVGVFAGMDYQELIEKKCFSPAYYAPVQNAKDFVFDSVFLQQITCSYKPGVNKIPLNNIYNSRITESIKKALQKFSEVFDGFIVGGNLIAPETRTSSPVRILRKSDGVSVENCPKLFAIGEGSGYAGGIVSSAADGYRIGSSLSRINYSQSGYGKDFSN